MIGKFVETSVLRLVSACAREEPSAYGRTYRAKEDA